jgi:hypothetical protein
MRINGNGQHLLNRVGKISYIRDYVIPEKIMAKSIIFIV